MEDIETKGVAVSMAATESTAATALTRFAEHALESAPSVSVSKVGEETSGLPTRRRKLTEVARLGSIQVVYPATRLKIELVFSAV